MAIRPLDKNETLIGLRPVLTVNHHWLDVMLIYIITWFSLRPNLRDARNPTEAGICLFSLPQPKSKQKHASRFYKSKLILHSYNSNGDIRCPSLVHGFNENASAVWPSDSL